MSLKVNSHQHPDADMESIGNAHPPNRLPRLFALIIGINEYKSDIIQNLLGAVHDANAMEDYLQKRAQCLHTRVLRDGEATRAAIIDGIEAFLLNDEIKWGDPIIIYYAGHGGWAKTPKHWEFGSTGRIEYLVPYDHNPLEDFDPKLHGIADRTLGRLLSQIADLKGDNITVILDCCHSGSGTRNFKDPTELVRGIDVVDISSDLDRDVERGTGVDAGHRGLRSHVLLAACGSEEFAFEKGGRGLFTEGLLDALTTLEIDKLTYTDLLQGMRLSERQSPQCEGDNQNRIIFNAKATSKSTVYYKIRRIGGEYVMPDAGTARGIRLGAEFEVYQDLDFGHSLGIVVAKKLYPFFTTLEVKESGFALDGDGVALQTSAGTEEHILRIHVADEGLKALVEKIERTDPCHRIIQLVEQDQAEFGMALDEDGKVVFDILDPLVTKHKLIRMSFTLEPTPEVISPVLRAADHFYWHLRRTPRRESVTEKGIADVVEIEVAEMEHTPDDNLELVLSPTSAGWRKDFDLEIKDGGTIYGWNIINNCGLALYPALFYFDTSDWSITSYYQSPTARGIVDAPLKGKGYLPVGYGDSGSVPHKLFLREGKNVDVGILKLFLSKEPVDSPPRPTAPAPAELPRATGLADLPIKARLLWDTILVPVVQRRADK